MEGFDQDEIGRLIARFLARETDEEETAKLQYWLQESAANRHYFDQVRRIWDVSDGNNTRQNLSAVEALNKVMKKIAAVPPRISFWHQYEKIAAILIIPLIAGNILWYLFSKNNIAPGNPTYHEVYATFGTRSAIKLADGTEVWLNSGSSLKYPDHFVGTQREVFLNGEAYFEVKSDPTKPFTVHSGALHVTATGTKFSVNDYSDKPGAEAVLVSGKVIVEKNEGNGRRKTLSDMKAGEILTYNKQTNFFTLKQEDTYKYVAWKDGKLIFRNDPLRVVVEKISQIYNVDIELQGKALQDYRYRATFQEESLGEILRLLKISSPIDYYEVKRTPLPDGTFPKKKVIIFPVGEKMVY